MKFTQRFLETVTCPEGMKDKLYFDTHTRGFGLRVSANGRRTFIAQYTASTGKRRVPVGTWGVSTLEQGRQAAVAILRAAEAGGDPVLERKAKARADLAAKARAEFTFERMVDEWVAARDGERRPSYLVEAKRCLMRNLEDWKARPASEITVREAVEALDAIKHSKSAVTANRVLAYGRAAFSWALRRERVNENPMKGIERPGREVSRDRVLSVDEIKAIWAACEGMNLALAGFVRVLALTLQRREEVAGLRWSEISADGMTWTLPRERTKNGRPNVIHLSEPARAIIASMPRIKDNPFVFAGRAGKAIAAFGFAKNHILGKLVEAEQDLPDWRLHDLRRSGATYLAGHSVAPHVVEKILNHVSGTISGVAAVYNRAEYLAERKAALDAWAAAVVGDQEARGITPP